MTLKAFGFFFVLMFVLAQGQPLLGLFNKDSKSSHSNTQQSSYAKSADIGVQRTASEDLVSRSDGDDSSSVDTTESKSKESLREVSDEKITRKKSLTDVREKEESSNLALLSSKKASKVTETDTIEEDKELRKDHTVDTTIDSTNVSRRGVSDGGEYTENTEETSKTTKDRLEKDENDDITKTKQITREDTQSTGLGNLLSIDNTSKHTTKEVAKQHRRKKTVDETTNKEYSKNTDGTKTTKGDGYDDTDTYSSNDGYTDSSSSSDGSEDFSTSYSKTEEESKATGLNLLGKHIGLISTGADKSGLVQTGGKGKVLGLL